MVRHTVVFTLKHQKNSMEEVNFFKAAKELATIEGVDKFECLRQTNKKNQFDYGLSMEFETLEMYDNYTNHPMHTRFVQDVWIPGVEDFLEIDYEHLE